MGCRFTVLQRSFLQAGPPADIHHTPYQHLDLRQYDQYNHNSGLTDEDLVLTPTKDLNKMLKSKGWSLDS